MAAARSAFSAQHRQAGVGGRGLAVEGQALQQLLVAWQALAHGEDPLDAVTLLGGTQDGELGLDGGEERGVVLLERRTRDGIGHCCFLWITG